MGVRQSSIHPPIQSSPFTAASGRSVESGLRVLFVSSWYPPIRSGSALWAEAMVKALRKRGNDVRVITTDWKGKPTADAQDEVLYHLPAWVVPKNRFLLGLSMVPVAWSYANRRRMLEIIRDFRPDVIHQVNHIFDTVFLSAYAARATGTPLVGTITTPIQSLSTLRQALMRALDRWVVFRFGVRHWQRVIAPDSTHVRYILDTYPEAVRGRLITHIHSGVSERIRAVPAEPKAPWPCIVSVGHVHEIRDPTNLIRAMPVILKAFPDAKLDIAGRVQFRRPAEEAERLGLGASVRFLGEVPVDAVPGLVSRAHVFAVLHQCRYAGLSSTGVEAMYFGTPVVTNAPADAYGPGVLRDGEHVVLVDGADVGQIAARIAALLGDKAMRDRVGRGGRDFVAQHLSWGLVAEHLEALYQQVRKRGP